jgi:hypothetical protein
MKVYATVSLGQLADLSAMVLTPPDVQVWLTAVPLVLDTLTVKTPPLTHFTNSSALGKKF